MKKQTKTKKLVLQKETLTGLQHVDGGSRYEQTVIIYGETFGPSGGCQSGGCTIS
jgi:hypothetical protein